MSSLNDPEEKKRILDEWLSEEIVSVIQEKQKSKKLIASGESAKSLRTVVFNVQGGELIRGQVQDGSRSFEYQERGRGPGKVPFGRIYAWLEWRKYGLDFSTEKEKKSLAWKIVNKIKSEGTYTNIKGIRTGVLSEVVTKENLDSLKAKILTDANLQDVATELTKVLNPKG
ncbi:MAG TPA: hypothetical protein PK840_05690 [Bacilli bacterium]|nr:hypothetical protein [Bacilli bacterium]